VYRGEERMVKFLTSAAIVAAALLAFVGAA
jgi:hypothetical protein